jgi:hypothetical protein
VLISVEENERLEWLMVRLEGETGKKGKWQKTDDKVKRLFLHALIAHTEDLKGHIFIEHFYRISDYGDATVKAIVGSIRASGFAYERAIIYVDGLSRSMVGRVAVHIRRYGIKTEKIKGLKDEQSALIRLCDAIAGFVRDYLEGEAYAKQLFAEFLRSELIKEI